MRAELRDGLEFLYADSVVSKTPRYAASLDIARGAIASVHVLLNDLPVGARLCLNLRRGGRAAAGAQCFNLLAVPVEVNTGPVGFIEKGRERNRFVTRRAPFRVFDAMAPVGATLKVTAPTMALRLHLPVAGGERPGPRRYTLAVQCARECRELALTVRVHRTVVPPVGRDSFPYTNWFDYRLTATRHGLTPWGEPHWRMLRRYARMMAHARQNTFWIPLRHLFVVKGKTITLDRKRLRRIVRIFTAAGLHYIEGGHVAGRTGGQWQARTFDLSLKRVRATSPAGNAVLATIGRQLSEEIDRNGWRSRWIQHVTDEPVTANADDYRLLVGMVRKVMPGVPILDASMDLSLVGSVDIWCPQAQEYQRSRKHFEAQRALGDRIWYYTCCFPGGPWLNRLMDMELLRPALFGWGAARYGLDGFLHWGLNMYRPWQDPFGQSVVKHGDENSLPAGDTHIVYPGPRGPWSSLRLEAQREGFEDYELLRRLRERDGRAASAIIRPVLRAFDNYTKNVTTFRAARRRLLEALAR